MPLKQNGKIASADFSDIYTINPDGTGEAKLTSARTPSGELLGVNEFPAFFPNGSKIAFVSTRDGMTEIYTMNADGTDQRRLTYGGAIDEWPGTSNLGERISVSPDGTKITFRNLDVRQDRREEIYTMNADGTGQTRLTYNEAADIDPTYSPDGRKIAFVSGRDGTMEIYTMNADGTVQRRLTHNESSEASPAFSPDGTKLAFVSGRDGDAEIYVMNMDGTGEVRLTQSKGTDDEPTFSPDGTKIAFVSWRMFPPGLYVMNFDGTDQKMVSKEAHGWQQPAWQPVEKSANGSVPYAESGAVRLKVKLSPPKPKAYPLMRVRVTQRKAAAKAIKSLKVEFGRRPDALSASTKRLARKGRARVKGKRIGQLTLAPVNGMSMTAHVMGKRGRIYIEGDRGQLRKQLRKVQKLRTKGGSIKRRRSAHSGLTILRKEAKKLRERTRLSLGGGSLRLIGLPAKTYRRISLTLHGRRDRILRNPNACTTIVFAAEIEPRRGKTIEGASEVKLKC